MPRRSWTGGRAARQQVSKEELCPFSETPTLCAFDIVRPRSKSRLTGGLWKAKSSCSWTKDAMPAHLYISATSRVGTCPGPLTKEIPQRCLHRMHHPCLRIRRLGNLCESLLRVRLGLGRLGRVFIKVGHSARIDRFLSTCRAVDAGVCRGEALALRRGRLLGGAEARRSAPSKGGKDAPSQCGA